ncbi:hypothetical protein SCHPADRAFT_506137 [Schizopora paradoxa]|uniref:Uncharacterized protein n=1 Tax=Schizopora paradoxa TaxID=27342 RepID=A0A0H2RMP1_9AGAM|nr:hypothetical protein SCHPADRAFT_506137 [Schizopora paradoxa]
MNALDRSNHLGNKSGNKLASFSFSSSCATHLSSRHWQPHKTDEGQREKKLEVSKPSLSTSRVANAVNTPKTTRVADSSRSSATTTASNRDAPTSNQTLLPSQAPHPCLFSSTRIGENETRSNTSQQPGKKRTETVNYAHHRRPTLVFSRSDASSRSHSYSYKRRRNDTNYWKETTAPASPWAQQRPSTSSVHCERGEDSGTGRSLDETRRNDTNDPAGDVSSSQLDVPTAL